MDTLNTIVQLLKEHYQWLFSGAGVVLIGCFFKLFQRRKASGQTQKIKNGTGIQAGRDVTIKDSKIGAKDD